VSERLSIGYLVPGHHLLPTAGPSRNVLSLARALARHADVTVAFRSTLQPPLDEPFSVLELDPGSGRPGASDDAAIRGIGVGELAGFLKKLRAFARAHRFDVVLEKSWLFSGHVGALYRREGVPAAVVENVVRVFGGGSLGGRVKHAVSQWMVGRNMRRADLVIAETAELERALIRRFRLAPERVAVVELGVDHALFAPGERPAAREALGIAHDARVLLYTGVLDGTHDLRPLLRAVTGLGESPVELHVVGDGELRGELETLARGAAERIVFHGRVPHADVPRFVVAADLCLAPYDLDAFPDREVAYSILKVPEYMACGRPVASMPGGRTSALIDDGRTGHLLENTAEAWAALVAALPARDVLDRMGAAASERVEGLTWENTAERYHELCRALV
jgi:glycosyltransferase involved in cell wall biosynthesis